MVHMRIIAPSEPAKRALELLCSNDSVASVAYFEGAAKVPEGDVILAEVAREDASVILSDLRELRIDEHGSISLEEVEAAVSDRAEDAEKHAAGAPSDAVVWEEVESRTSESTEMSWSFLVFMIVAGLIASVGIFLDSAILIVGAMVVGPEFGPIAGFCVAAANRRTDVAWRSFRALMVGFPVAIAAVWVAAVIFRATGLTPEQFSERDHNLADIIASPDFFSFFVAACAGVAGVLSLSTAKSGALIGVLISVTTIPAASNIGVAAAYGDSASLGGSIGQLAINITAILAAGTITLWIQRRLYMRRRIDHLSDPSRREVGLPVGRSARAQRR